MTYGVIKAMSHCWKNNSHTLRVLVSLNNDDWCYMYIPANNYKWKENDIVSFGDRSFYWHNEKSTIRFDMVEDAVKL